MALCARQMVDEFRKTINQNSFGNTWKRRSVWRSNLRIAAELRERLCADESRQMAEFLEWFDEWFLRRAPPVEQEVEA